MRWIGFMKQAIGMSLQELTRAVEDKTLWISLIHRVTRSQNEFNNMWNTCNICYAYIYTHLHMCIYTYTHVCTYTFVVCILYVSSIQYMLYIHVHIHLCMNVCVYIYIYTFVFVKIKGLGISPLKDIDGSLCEWDLFDIVIERD